MAGASFLEQVKAYRILDVVAQQGKPFDVDVQVITLGRDIAWVALPGECFVELGLSIKAASPFRQTNVVELANGRGQYIPNRSAFPEGQYEVVSTRYAEGAGETLRDHGDSHVGPIASRGTIVIGNGCRWRRISWTIGVVFKARERQMPKKSRMDRGQFLERIRRECRLTFKLSEARNHKVLSLSQDAANEEQRAMTTCYQRFLSLLLLAAIVGDCVVLSAIPASATAGEFRVGAAAVKITSARGHSAGRLLLPP